MSGRFPAQTTKRIAMSKNISTNLNLFKIVAIALVAMALSANSAVWGQTQQNPLLNQTVSRAYGLIDVPCYPGASSTCTICGFIGYITGSHYDPRLSPFPDSHITLAGNRIDHYVGSRLNGISGPSIGDPADAANRLWDTAYSNWGYTKVDPTASIDPSMNCHGYATKRGAWMSLTPALFDDYELASFRDHLVPGAIFAHIDLTNGIHVMSGFPPVNSHSSRIDAVHQLAGTHDQ